MMRLIFLPLLLFSSCALYASDMPPDSHPNIFGTGWTCNRGYYKSGQRCEKVIVPENAGIDLPGSGWTCNRGYYKSGQRCEKVIVPENAHVDLHGNGSTCNDGFKKASSACVAMTQQEILNQAELQKALAA